MKKSKILSTIVVIALVIGLVGTAIAASVQAETLPDVKVIVNGQELKMTDVNGKEVEALFVDGTTYLPVRAIGEELGVNVDWNGETREVTVNKTKAPTGSCYAETQYGDVRGYTFDGVDYFLGIPYAKAARFHMPEAPDAWTGTVRACMMQGEVSPQNKTTMEGFDAFAYSTEMVENEDTCLNLNVYTTDTEGSKPVIFWMHGGGFSTGGSVEKTFYAGAAMAEFGDVVFVSVNHRLNCVGYLDLSAYGDEYKYSGNAGMADLVMALEWVKTNIKNFGGDPDNVTIVGQSGGGTKVTTLMGMPAAQGLFHKAMAISGGSAKVTRTTEQAQAETAKVMEVLGFTTAKELEEVDYVTLAKACDEAGVSRSYGPVVDGDYYPTGTYEMSKDIPFMCGNVLGEFSTNFANWLYVPVKGVPEMTALDKMTEEMVLGDMAKKFDGDTEKAAAAVAAFKEAYPDHAVGEILYLNNRASGMSSYPLAEAMESYGGTVYQYIQATPYPMWGGVVPVHTAGDVPMWFHNVDMIPAWVAGEEAAFYDLQDEMAGALVSFAKTGSPSTETLEWKPWTSEEDGQMVFDFTSGMRYHHEDKLFDALPKGGGFPF